MTKHGFYPRHRDTEVDASPSFPQMEGETLAFWAADDTFRKSIDARPAGKGGQNEFVFYDGPPFANGLPHYGHLLTGDVKDIVGRYQTMLGHRVERRFGWDTHGLPAELEACDTETCRWQLRTDTGANVVHPIWLIHKAYGLH